MVGCAQGLIGSFKTAAAPAASKKCTSLDLALGCCLATGGCAPAGIASGIACSPQDAENTTWTYNC